LRKVSPLALPWKEEENRKGVMDELTTQRDYYKKKKRCFCVEDSSFFNLLRVRWVKEEEKRE